MALVLETFINFESGTFHELYSAVGAAQIVTDPAPPYEHETYGVFLPSFGAAQGNIIYVASVPVGRNKYAIGFYVRFHKVGSILEQFFFRWGEGGVNVWDFSLQLEDDGAFSIYDTNEALVATSSTGVFAANTWHLVELLFTRGDPGDLIIHVDENEVLNTSGEDYDSVGAYNVSAMVKAQQGASPELVSIYVSSMYIYSGASSVADFAGHYGSLTYQNRRATAVPDVGDNLDAGTWEDCAEIPFDDAAYAKYTGNDKGIVTTHISDGGMTPGPYGDSRIKDGDVILGASWLLRYYYSFLSSGWLHHGKIPHDTPGVDGTSSTGMTMAGGIRNMFVISGVAIPGSMCPSRNDYFQYGMRGQALGAADVRLYDCSCSLLIKLAVPGARGITLGCGYASRDRDILVG